SWVFSPQRPPRRRSLPVSKCVRYFPSRANAAPRPPGGGRGRRCGSASACLKSGLSYSLFSSSSSVLVLDQGCEDDDEDDKIVTNWLSLCRESNHSTLLPGR